MKTIHIDLVKESGRKELANIKEYIYKNTRIVNSAYNGKESDSRAYSLEEVKKTLGGGTNEN